MGMLLDDSALRADMDHLIATDSLFARVFTDAPPTRPWEQGDMDFEAFAETIVSQQLSTKAAATIWGRLQARSGGCVTPDVLLGMDVQDIRACGVSAQKLGYLTALANDVQGGRFAPERLPNMNDAQVVEAITALHGFGVWSAQMVLIFCLMRRNVFPSGDLGVLEGLRILRGLPVRPKPADAAKYAARRWKGRATAATLLLWEVKERG